MNKPSTFIFSPLFVALTMLIALLFCKCSREYSYEGGNVSGTSTGSAVYTLSGEGASCLGSVINGNYYVGTMVGVGNTVELQVNVTTVGSYELITNLVDGIKFSAKGIFTVAGTQSITLQASGTPLAAGYYTYTPPVGLGCSFIIKVTQAPAAIAGFTFNGAPNKCTKAKVNGDYIIGKALSPDNTVVISVNVTAVGAYTIKTDTIDGISFSQSGQFTSIGVQDVTLLGSGTANSPDNLVFTPYGNSPGCTFKITVLNLQPLATYVLESGSGNSGPCTYTTAGRYLSNTPLNSSNSVSLRVFVTVPGNFTISTKTVNGITFSYTGTFTAIGSQYVTLSGRGTPVSSGTYNFFPEIVGPSPLGGETCALSIIVS